MTKRSKTTNRQSSTDPAGETRVLPIVPARGEQDEIVVPLVDEQLQVQKDRLEAGAVVIKKRVESREETLPVELEYEEVELERVPVNRKLAYGENAAPRHEGDMLIIPIVEEHLVVTKEQIITEELHIRKKRKVRQEEVRDTVRRTHLDLESTGNLDIANQ